MVVTGRVTGDEEEDAPVGASNGLGELLQPVGTVTVGQRSTVVLRRTQPPAGEGNVEANL